MAVTARPKLYFHLANLLAPCKCHKLKKFWSGGRGLPREVLSDPCGRSCWHRTHPGCSLLLAWVYGSEGEQPAPCKNHSTSNHVSSCEPFFSMSPSYPLPCMAALTGITITMLVLWVWSWIWDGFVGSTPQLQCWKHRGMMLNGVIQRWGRFSHAQSCVHCLEVTKSEPEGSIWPVKGIIQLFCGSGMIRHTLGSLLCPVWSVKKAENAPSQRQSIMPSHVSKYTCSPSMRQLMPWTQTQVKLFQLSPTW